MAETRFAFIIHPLSASHLKSVMQEVGFKKNGSRSLDPVPLHLVSIPFSFATNQKVVCDVVLCPSLPEQMVKDEHRSILEILKAIKIAKSLGSRLVGLGGFTSIIGNAGVSIATDSSLPVTSGNTYTSFSVVKSILMTGESRGIDFRNSCIAIIGATGDIGSACAKFLSDRFGKIILVARNDGRLEMLARDLKPKCAQVCIEKSAGKAAAEANVIITATSALTTLIGTRDLRVNSIVCDVSYPANVAREIHEDRSDVFVFEGGIVSSERFISQIHPESVFWKFNPPGGMHACFVETMLLALERRFINYSIGRGLITKDKMCEIGKLGEGYGFQPVFIWDGSEYPQASGMFSSGESKKPLAASRRSRLKRSVYFKEPTQRHAK